MFGCGRRLGYRRENGLLEQLSTGKNGNWPNTGTGREEVKGWLWLWQREKLRESVYPVDGEQCGQIIVLGLPGRSADYQVNSA